jgi:hypothetical protein
MGNKNAMGADSHVVLLEVGGDPTLQNMTKLYALGHSYDPDAQPIGISTNYGNTSHASRPLHLLYPRNRLLHSSAAWQREPLALRGYVRGEDKCTLFEPGPSCLSALCVHVT